MNNDLLKQAFELDRAGRPFAVATVVRAEKPTSAKPGANAIITADGTLIGWIGGSCAQPTVVREALKCLQDGQPRFVRLCPPEKMGQAPQQGVIEVTLICASGGTLEVYIEPHAPRPHLVVIGHLPVAEALTVLGKDLGYEVTVMGMNVIPDRFSRADRVIDHLDFSQLQVTSNTYIVVASHGNYDEEALSAALRTEAGYVALVVSRKRAETVVQYLRDDGLSEEQLVRLKYPAGLDIKAATPEEIALSILAEIVQMREHLPAMQLPSPPQAAEPAEAIDPVCGMTVEIATARYTAEYGERTYYFCSGGCKRSFEKEPEKYLVASDA